MVLMSNAAHAGKGVLIPVAPFPGATSTSVFDIGDDNKTIVGSYVDSDGVTHAFVGTLGGEYTSFDFGSGGTQARAVDRQGQITGFSNVTSTDHCTLVEWERSPSGVMHLIKDGRKPLNGIAQGFNKFGFFAGDYCAKDGTVQGYYGVKRKLKFPDPVPFETDYTSQRGINSKFETAGFFVDPDTELQVGFISAGGGTGQLTYPDPNEVSTVLEGINESDLTSGQWTDTSGIIHGFSYGFETDIYTQIDDPNATSYTQAWGVNKSGLIAISSDAGSYIYCSLKPSKCPSGGTEIETREIRGPGPFSPKRGGPGNHARPAHVMPFPRGAALQ